MKTDSAYISKTVKQGNITITIRRPVLDNSERNQRKQQITDSLERGLVDYLKRS